MKIRTLFLAVMMLVLALTANSANSEDIIGSFVVATLEDGKTRIANSIGDGGTMLTIAKMTGVPEAFIIVYYDYSTKIVGSDYFMIRVDNNKTERLLVDKYTDKQIGAYISQNILNQLRSGNILKVQIHDRNGSEGFSEFSLKGSAAAIDWVMK